jgi:hypothetical protein
MPPKLPFKKFLDKIKSSLTYRDSFDRDIPFKLHQRTVVGNVVYLGSLPEKKGVNITAEAKKLIKRFGMSPDEINCGNCDQFADELQKKVGGTVVGSPDGTHFWLLWNGKYYDAQNPDGVKQLETLSYFKGWKNRK